MQQRHKRVQPFSLRVVVRILKTFDNQTHPIFICRSCLQELKAVKDAVKKLGKKRKVGACSCMVHCLSGWHCSTQQASAD